MSDRTTVIPRWSWAEVCARRLERQALTSPSSDARPADIVRAMCGAHAQVLSAAELSIALRIAGITRADVREALWVEHSLIKTFGPRGTVHLLPAEDLPMWIGALSAAPPPPNNHPEDVRMTPEQTEEIVEAIGIVLEDAELTIDELSDAVVTATGPWAGDLVVEAFQGKWPRWRQAHALAGIRGALCFGPNRGRKVTYTSPRRWLPEFQPADGQAALADLVKGHLHAYGPATPQQLAHWLNAPPRWAMELFDSLSGELQQVEVHGTPTWVAAGDTAVPPAPPRGVRLLPYFDAYAYRWATSHGSCSTQAGPRHGCRETSKCCSSTGWLPGFGTSAAPDASSTSRSNRWTRSPPRSAASSTTRWSGSERSSRRSPS